MMRLFGSDGEEFREWVDMSHWMPSAESNSVTYHFPEKPEDFSLGVQGISNILGEKDTDGEVKCIHVYPKFNMYSIIEFQKTYDGKDLIFVIYKLIIRVSLKNSFTIKFGYNSAYSAKKDSGLLDIVLPFLSHGIIGQTDTKMTLFNRTNSVEGMVVLEYLNDIMENRVLVGEDNRFGFFVGVNEKEMYDEFIRDSLLNNSNWKYKKGDYSPEPSPSQT